MRALQNIAQRRLQPQLRAFAVVLSVDQDAAFFRLVEAADEVDDRGLARAGLADERDGFACADVQVEVLEERFAFLVEEVHMVERDVARDRLPVFALRVHGGAVFCFRFRRVLYLGLGVQKPQNTLCARLRALHVGEDGSKLLNRVKQTRGIGDEHHEIARGDPAEERLLSGKRCLYARAAEDQRHCRSDRAERNDEGEEGSGQDGRLHACFAHVGRDRFELRSVLFLTHQRLGRHRAHDALVERAGDAGIVFSRHTLIAEDPALQVQTDHGKRRNDRKHDQRQLPVEAQHGHGAADDIEERPQKVRDAPRDHFRKPRNVADHARHQVADGRLVIERERQRLQFQICFLTDRVGNEGFQLARVADKAQRAEALQNHQRNVCGEESPDSLGRGDAFRTHETVNGEFRQNRIDVVHNGGDQHEQNDLPEQSALSDRVAEQTLPDFCVHFFIAVKYFFFVTHACSPPSA